MPSTQRVNAVLKFERPDYIPIFDLYWGGFIESWRNHHSLPPKDGMPQDDVYYEDTGDDGDSDTYGGNFLHDWQDAHTLGVDYYENWMTMEGYVYSGDHTTQHITANRKAYAMWWILARIAGWDGEGSAGISPEVSNDLQIYPNPASDRFFIENQQGNIEAVSVIDAEGREVLLISPRELSSKISIDLSTYAPGMYSVRAYDKGQNIHQSKLILIQ